MPSCSKNEASIAVPRDRRPFALQLYRESLVKRVDGGTLRDVPSISKLIAVQREMQMRHRFVRSRVMALLLAGTALGLSLSMRSAPAHAAPFFVQAPSPLASRVTQAKIYRRGRTPIYPYYYNPGRPGGYSFYFGFVPYTPGNVENQAIQRGQYPQDIQWPPGLYGGPRPGWGPKAWD